MAYGYLRSGFDRVKGKIGRRVWPGYRGEADTSNYRGLWSGFVWVYAGRVLGASTGRINPDRLFQRVIIWRARKAFPDLSIPQLALQVRMPANTVRRAVKLLEVSPREVLEAFEHQAVGSWLQAVPIASAKGDHRPAKDLLLHTRAIDPVQLQGQTQIAIIFAGAEVPGLTVSPYGGDCINVSPSKVDDRTPDVRAVCANSGSAESGHQTGPAGSSG